MQLTNCKVKFKLRWTKYFILSVLGAANTDNDNGTYSNNKNFTIKVTNY